MPVTGVLLGIVAACGAVCTTAFAQSSPEAGFQLPAVPSLPSSGEGPTLPRSLRVHQIAFKGNKVLQTSVLQAVAAAYLDRELTPEQIEELRIALTHQYTDRGYVNSGVLLDPAQPYSDGTLHFRVIEGRITQVRVHGLKRLRPAYVIGRLGDPDQILNTNALRERFQRLLDDPLFERINTRIVPGSALGEATLDVEAVRARPYALTVALNNYRPPSIGEKGYDVAGLVRDLTGFGDVFDLDVSGPIGVRGGTNYSGGWLVPLNRHDTQLSIRGSYADTVVTEQPLEVLDIESKIDREELRVIQPLWGSLAQQFNLGASIAREKDATELGGIPFSFLAGANAGVTRSVTARLIADYSFRSGRQYLGLRLTILHANLLDLPTGQAAYVVPDQKYFVWTGQAHHLLEWPAAHLELETRIAVQRAGSRISDLHAVEIGGIASVRGFRENELLVGNAQDFNLDLHWVAIRYSGGARPGFTFGPFFDWASGRDVGEPTTTFSSIGATFRFKWTHVQADLAVGKRLVEPGFVQLQHGSWQDHGIEAQVAASL